MKNQTLTIRKIVTYLNNEQESGGYWLPNIQRPFVWHEEQIEKLFDSIMREYPISTLLVWKTQSKIRRRKFIDTYKKSLKLTDFYVPEDESTKHLVLDGQQRLQSLFIGLKGSYEKKELYFNILSGDLIESKDIRYEFKFLNKEKAKFPFILFKKIVFDNQDADDVASDIIDDSFRELSKEEKKRINKNVLKIAKLFKQNEVISYQELDSVDNPKLYTENDVVEIFIRANDGGTKLGKSDLLFSLLTSSWEDAEDKLEDLLEVLNKTGYKFTRDFILKTCLTLVGKGAKYDVAKFRDGKTKESIIEQWDNISESIKDIKDFLYGKTFLRCDKALPSYLGLIPLIYFRYKFPNKWKSAKDINNYLLRVLLTGSFSGTPDNLIDKCINEIDRSECFNVEDIFTIIKNDGRNLLVSLDSLLSIHYTSKDIHLIFNLWYKDFNYTPSYENNLPQIDHIFPQSQLKTIKEINPKSDRKNILKYQKFARDQIANCMLLTAEENGAGGKCDTIPEQWFADKNEDYLNKHLIPRNRELWKLENYEQFIEERKKLIAEKFEFILDN